MEPASVLMPMTKSLATGLSTASWPSCVRVSLRPDTGLNARKCYRTVNPATAPGLRADKAGYRAGHQGRGLENKNDSFQKQKSGVRYLRRYVCERNSRRGSGHLHVVGRQYKGGIDLPNGPLSFTTASAFSSNNKWLAVSQNSRGAVWNVETGERVFLTRGFQGAFFDEDQLFAKFPKQGSESAAIFKMDAAPKKRKPFTS